MDEQLLERLRSQLTFLVVVDEKLKTCTDELQRTLLNAMRALAEAGAPIEEIMPLVDFELCPYWREMRRKLQRHGNGEKARRCCAYQFHEEV